MSQSCHVFLTGPPGIGKTTLIKKLCENLKTKNIPVNGFYTEEVRTSGIRTGFDVVSLSGQRSNLARATTQVRGPTVGKYTVDIKSFEDSVLPLLDVDKSYKKILVVDEIGKMELFSEKFKMKMRKILNEENKITVLGTIPVRRGIAFVEEIRGKKNVQVFEISKENRDNIFHDVFEKTIKIFQQK